jgi:dihydroxy-acid dehydratase
MPSRAISASTLNIDDWQQHGHDVPLLVNLQPAGEYLGEDYHHAGGVPAVVAELMKAGMLPHPRTPGR